MVELLAGSTSRLRSGGRAYTSSVIDLLDPATWGGQDIGRETARLRVRVARPTIPAEEASWPAGTEVEIVLHVEVDGQEMTVGQDSYHDGGVVTFKGDVHADSPVELGLPSGWLLDDAARFNEADWGNLRRQRWGETAQTSFTAWATIRVVSGPAQLQLDFTLEADVTPENKTERFHRSIGALNYTTGSVGSGNGNLTITGFTASSGTNRIAVLSGAGTAGAFPAFEGATYDSNSSAVAESQQVNQYGRMVMATNIDTEIGSGSKNITYNYGNVDGGVHCVVGIYEGVDQTTPATGVTDYDGANSGTFNDLSLAGTTSGNWIIAHGYRCCTSAIPTPKTNQTSISSGNGITSGGDGGDQSYQAVDTDTTPGWTVSGDEWGSIAIEIGAASSGDATISGEASTATAAAQAPTPALTAPSPAATSTAAAQAPTPVLAVPAAASAATAAANAPTISAIQNVTIPSEAATATAAAAVPTPALTVPIAASTATAAAPTPTPTLTIPAAASTATAAAPAPTIDTGANVTIAGEAATATAAAAVPTIAAIQNATIASEAATATAAAQSSTPALSVGTPAATATASALAAYPVVAVAVAVATAAAQAYAPTISVPSGAVVGTVALSEALQGNLALSETLQGELTITETLQGVLALSESVAP